MQRRSAAKVAVLAILAGIPAVSLISGLFIAPLLGLLAVLSALSLSVDGMQRRVPYGLAVIAAGFVMYAGLSIAWSPDFKVSLRAWQHIALIAGGGMLLWIALPQLTARQSRVFMNIAAGMLLAASVIALAGVWNDFALARAVVAYVTPQQEFSPSFFNRFATVLVLLIWPMLGASLIMRSKLGLAAVLAAAVTVGVLDSLAATVTLGVALVVFALTCWRMGLTRIILKAGWVAAVLGMLVYFGPLYDPPAPEVLVAQIDNLSVLHRVFIWDFTANAAFEHFPFGIGIGASRTLPGGEAVFYPGMVYVPAHPHNQALQIALELGLPGVILLLGVGLWLIRRSGIMETTRIGRAAALTTVVAYCMVGGMSYSAWQSWWLSAAFVTAAWVRLLCYQTPGGKSAGEGGKAVNP